MARSIALEAGSARDPLRVAADLLVVPVAEGELENERLRALDRGLEGGLLRQAKDAAFRGQSGKSVLHRLARGGRAKSVLLVGLGKAAERTGETWRKAGGGAAAVARGEAAARIAVWIEGDVEAATAFAEGFALALYRFDRYRRKEKEEDRRTEPARLSVLAPGVARRSLRSALEELGLVVETLFAARDLVNEPPSEKSAEVIARRAVALCRGRGVRVEVLGPREIRRQRLAGLLAVNRGSTTPPRFLRIRYRPAGRTQGKVALVGKGITFDSGGLSLKPAKSMETMKLDMAGAAAVIGVMSVVGRLKPKVAVTGYVPLTDNLPSGSAQKPGDVIRYRNGKSVEVLNTDAEGRLVLADALCLASEEKHDVVIDLATLTGACMVALGTQVAGILGNDEALVDELVRHGKAAGESLWPLPLVKEYRDELKSSVADLKNVGGGYAGTITAALFLQEFVEGAKWAHLDIAGPAFAERDLAYCPRGGTGFGIRTLLRYLRSR
jgi:leucyl aminopeptidase